MKVTQQPSRLRYAHSLIALAVAAAFPLHGALAQEVAAEAKADKGQLDTVIVTAQRRAENIKDVPMSISAIGGDKLDALNTSGQDIRFLSGRAPSLNIESDYGRTFPRFYIRGFGNTDFDLNASQPVGLVYDDIVLESPMIKGFPVFDVDQVEVLRGPQGTLFGRNSPAGVIKFESTKPTRKFEGYVNASYGNYGASNVEAALNTPLGQDWAMRISLLTQNRDDRVHNTYAAGPTRDFEGYSDNAARILLSYKPSKDFSALFNIHARDMHGNAMLFRANIIEKGTNNLVPGFNYDSYPTDGVNRQTLNSSGASAHLRWDFDGMSFHSITGFERVTYYSRGDVDGGYGAVYAQPSGPGVIPFVSETADGMPQHRQFTQELRLESNNTGPLNWIGGLYYFNEDLTIDSIDYNSLAPGNPQDGFAQQHQHATSWATFASLNYALTSKLKVRGGVRYTDDKKDFVAQRFVTPGGGAGVGPLTADPRSSNTTYDLSATYELDKDTNVYARVATGYRAPSIQGRVLFGNSISVAKSEKVLSFETGVKEELFNKRARVSVGVFQYRVNDMQLTAGSGTVNQNQLINAAKVTGQGFEFDAQANLSPNWKATLGGSFNDTEIKDPSLSVAACGGGCTVTSANVVQPDGSIKAFINGNPLPRAPKWTTNATLRYSTPVANGEFYAFTDWAYRSKYNFFLYEAKEYVGKSLLEGGLRAGYKWNNYELAAYVRNLTNRVQLVAAIDFNNLTGMVNEPRAYGVQFKASF